MNQAFFCLFLSKSLKQRLNFIGTFIIIECLLPCVLFALIVSVKFSVKDHAIYKDSYDEDPIIEGPNKFGSLSASPLFGDFNLSFPFQNAIKLFEFYNPYKICKILNESVIAFIGDFEGIEELNIASLILTLQKNESRLTDSEDNFTFTIRKFTNKDFEIYLMDPLYKTFSDVSNSKPGVCIGIEGNYNNYSHTFNITFRFSDDFYWKNYFQQSRIQLKPSTTILTSHLENLIQGNLAYTKLTQGGFLYFQNIITQGLIALKGIKYSRLYYQTFTSKLHNSQKLKEYTFLQKIKSFLQILIGLIFFYISSRIIYFIGQEKELKIICLMYIKGMNKISYWLSILIEYVILSAIISLSCTLLTSFQLIVKTNGFLIFFIYFIHSFNELCFSIAITSFLNSSTISLIISNLIYFMTMLLGIFVNTYEFAFSIIEYTSLFSPIGGISLISLIIDYEIKVLNQILTISEYSEYQFKIIILILIEIMSSFLFLTIGIVLSSIMNNSIGLPKILAKGNYSLKYQDLTSEKPKLNQYYLEIPKLLFGFSEKNNNQEKIGCVGEKNYDNFDTFNINAIKKEYNSLINFEEKISFNIQLLKNDVLVLIGENGSGKTSFLNLISGLINEDNILKDLNSFKNLKEIEKQLKKYHFGINNKDMLGIPDLTINQNLKFFDLLTNSKIDNSSTHYFKEFSNVNNIPQEVGDKFPDELSLGMKHIFALAIAYAGNPGIILLDNPTIGLDYRMKEHVLNKIMEFNTERITILVTQAIDEAEKIGSKFVLISKGKFCLFNSLNNFKKGWNTNYTLVFDKKFRLNEEKELKFVEKFIENSNNENNLSLNKSNDDKSNLDSERCLNSKEQCEQDDSIKNKLKELENDLTKFIKDKLFYQDEKIPPRINNNNKCKIEEYKNEICEFYNTERHLKISLNLKHLNPDITNLFFQNLKDKINTYKINLFSIFKQSLEDIFIQIIDKNKNRINSDDIETNEFSVNESNISSENKINQNNHDSQNKKNYSNCFSYICNILKILIFKRHKYYPSEFWFGLTFALLLMLILCIICFKKDFQYSYQIPKIIYDYSNYSLDYEIADPTFVEGENITLTKYHKNLYEYFHLLSNRQIIKKEDTSKVKISDRIKNFSSYISSEGFLNSKIKLGGIQIWRFLENKGRSTVSTFLSFLNYSSPLSIETFHAELFDLLLRTLTDNQYSVIFTNYPQPVSSYTQSMMKIKVSLIPINFLIFDLTVLYFLLIIQIFRENNQGICKIKKFYQGSFAYWFYNYMLNVVDSIIINLLFILVIIISIKLACNFYIDNIIWSALENSISNITFYYFQIILWNKYTKRISFSKDILLLNIITGNILPSLIQILQRFQELEKTIKILEIIFQFVFPNFAFHQLLYHSLERKAMNYYPENINFENVDLKIKFSFLGMLFSIIFYSFLNLILIQFYTSPCLLKTKEEKSTTIKELTQSIQKNLSNNGSKNNMNEKNNNKLFLLGKTASGKSLELDNLILSQDELKKIIKKILLIFHANNDNQETKGIGYCPEYLPFISYFSVKENLKYFLKIKRYYNQDKIPNPVEKIMKSFNISNFQNSSPESLSDGQTKLFKLAIAFIGNPSLVLIDDLSSELDPVNRIDVWNLLSNNNDNFNKNHMIISSHNYDELFTLTNNYVVKNYGELMKISNLNQILNCLEPIDYYVEYCVKYYSLDQINEFETQNEQNLHFLSEDAIKEKLENECNNIIFLQNNQKEIPKEKIINKLIKEIKEVKEENNQVLNIVQFRSFLSIFLALKEGISYIKEYKEQCNVKLEIRNDSLYFQVYFNCTFNKHLELIRKFTFLNLQKRIELISIMPFDDRVIIDCLNKQIWDN